MRLIDADALISDGGFVHEVDNEVYWEKEDIDHAPTIEAEPVRHGRWRPTAEYDSCYCSRCLKQYTGFFASDWNYCPNCGARMDGDEA